ncbi:MAG: sigma-70 family RNA polymerase sigma factor [Acidobacteriota bacterium]
MTAALDAVLAADVERARGGDAEAFTRLVEKTSSMVCSVAFAIVRDVPASEDIAQDVFLSVWRGLGKLQNPKSFLPWLRQVTRNRANSWLRGVYTRREHDRVDEEQLARVSDPEPTADLSLEERETLEVVARSLEEIPDEAREVLVLYYREGRSTKQVADLLGLSEAAVRKRLSRAREQLRADVTERLRRGLERTAPGAALVMAVAASLQTAAPASAAVAGGLGARTAAGALKMGGFAGLLAALPGLLGGVAGVVLGLRPDLAAARDERERRSLLRLRATAIAAVCATVLGLVWSGETGTWWVPSLIYVLFLGTLGVLYRVWLPSIVRDRLAAELAEDPEAHVRHARRRRAANLGFFLGTLFGTGGLIAGLWMSGLLF